MPRRFDPISSVAAHTMAKVAITNSITRICSSPEEDSVPVPVGLISKQYTQMLRNMVDLTGCQDVDEYGSTSDEVDRESEEFDEDQSGTVPSSVSSGQDGITTMMVRNVPVMYTQEMLLQEWPNYGQYNFLYLPRSAAGQSNLSYAFINFVSEAHAQAFKQQWQKKRLTNFTAKKALNISVAEVQGLQANLAQLKKKRVRRIHMRQCQPYIVQNARRVELAEALVANFDDGSC